MSVIQDPVPGRHLLRFRGDTQTLRLILPRPRKGTAWLRTNIGHADVTRTEIIREVDFEETPLGRGWFDVPMKRSDDRTFQITVPLNDVGHFEAKCFFLDKTAAHPVWPQGSNCVINVEPADTCCFNTLYNAFVRQFGPNKAGGANPEPAEETFIRSLDKKGYTIIPPSGKFRDLINELDFIIGELGCRFIQLLPIHPTPTTYGRMGRFGSPFAALSFKTVDPALAVFDPKATPLEQFIELVDAVHARSAKIILDIAINHTGWAARLHDTHPQWLARDPEGKIEVPGAWGVRWEDLTKLDYSHSDLWQFMAELFITWCRRGVDGFRCDAGYMIPLRAWKYIIASVREQYPDTLFFLEGLGGKLSVTRALLDVGNFNWAYSELFQNYDRNQIEHYLPGVFEISDSEGILVHFSETHDNTRVAAQSLPYAKMRTALCALCSHQGAFGFANGVEWFAAEKIDVHSAPPLNWGHEVNQVREINRLTTLLRTHPAFFDRTELTLIQRRGGNQIVLLRRHIPTGKRLLVLANLDDRRETRAEWEIQTSGIHGVEFVDLLTDEPVIVETREGLCSYLLEPGCVRCLSPDAKDLERFHEAQRTYRQIPDRIARQEKRALVMNIIRFYSGFGDVTDADIAKAAERLAEDPEAFCRSVNPSGRESRVISWLWPRDTRREVMVPPGHFLLVKSAKPFGASITDTERTAAHQRSLRQADGTYFALFSPLPVPDTFRALSLKLSVYTDAGCRHEVSPLLFLPEAQAVTIRRTYHRPELLHRSFLLLGTNGRGGMLHTPVAWGELLSRYDALLAANPNPDYPEDRRILLTRCRAWVVYQDFSQEIGKDCLDLFRSDNDSSGVWQFHVPTGQGEHILLTIWLEMIQDNNAVRIRFYRQPSDGKPGRLDDDKKVHLILRPDIENRNFHETTKAYSGPEHYFPTAVHPHADGFTFTADPKHPLTLRMKGGTFVREPEWRYMVRHPQEAERGQDPDSDLFSPGYFQVQLKGGRTVELTARVADESDAPPLPAAKPFRVDGKRDAPWDPGALLSRALDHYVVRRGELKSVIAGYPWFLDWGRDALIVVRGVIADGRLDDARLILKQFAQYEVGGTLPNMIRGDDAGNRDTSDAPLWFFVAVNDLLHQEGNDAFLNETFGKRTVRDILVSIGTSLSAGSFNGIRVDPESGCIFSPNHFTWMDTNYPAGTPRAGYPIEIQALWFAALSLLARIDPHGDWKARSEQVQKSIHTLFFREELGFLADCLHAESGNPASKAAPDDALRPNQLFAVTLGAVSDPDRCRKVVTACEELLVPGAIRSLADRPVRRPLPIYHSGKLLNDPHHPYRGKYAGDEDTQRKPAYHNGTAWTWVFPSFCEAWAKAFGPEAKETARAWLASCAPLLESGCIGQIPEILDGDYPHRQRGCDAQAWGVSEALRVWKLLS